MEATKKVTSTKLSLLFVSLVLAITGLVMFSNSYTNAASQSVNVSYQTYGSGFGQSSGKRNGVWHYFRGNRPITLKVNSYSGGGNPVATLYRNVNFWVDKSFGNVGTTWGNRTFPYRSDVTSGSYYLIFWGGWAQTTQRISGYIHD